MIRLINCTFNRIRILNIFVALMSALALQTAHAGRYVKPKLQANETQKIEAAVDAYYEMKNNRFFPMEHENDCHKPSPMACVKYLCDTKFSCGYDATISATKACRGNYGSDCLKYICNEKFSCGWDAAITSAKACRGNIDMECVRYVCSVKFSCGFDTVISVAKSCGGGDQL